MGYVIALILIVIFPAFVPLAVIGIVVLAFANAFKPDGRFDDPS